MRSFYESGGSGCHFAGLMAALHPLTSTLATPLTICRCWCGGDAYWEGEREGGWGD